MSKCIGVCKLEDGVCIGCARTIGEIVAEGKVAKLEAKLAEAVERAEMVRSFIETLPIDCMGTGSSPTCGEWPLRDEVIDTLSTMIRNACPEPMKENEETIKLPMSKKMISKMRGLGAYDVVQADFDADQERYERITGK